MRTLIYKRTHFGDPDPESGVFGNNNCMGRVKGWQYDAVIGVGGIGPEPTRNGIAGKLTWVGLGPHKAFNNPNDPGSPRVTFDHFWYLGESGPSLEVKYPALARRMYEKNVRVLMHTPRGPKEKFQVELETDINKILVLARRAPASQQMRKAKRKVTSGSCRAKSC
jgi:hypothetical protein